MKILVTGGAGYLGSTLLPKLLLRGHQVKVIDVGYFGFGHLKDLNPKPQMVREDLRRILEDKAFADELFNGVEAVIHLAALSNDPSSELDPDLTHELNCKTTIAVARIAKERKIKFLFASTCSIYGASDEMKTETSAVNPLTTYAISKRNAEEAILKMKTEEWQPTIFRFGTLFGFSPRMRFDLVVNIFSLFSQLHKEIKIFGTGEFSRPFLHVKDAARAFVYFLEKTKKGSNLINISNENLTVNQVAKTFSELIPGLKLNYFKEGSEDKRNYRVDNSLMYKEGFKPFLTVEYGAQEIQEALTQGLIQDPESLYYQNVKWLKELGMNPNPVSHSFKKAA